MPDEIHSTIQQVRERLLVLERERIDLLRQLDVHERQAFLDASSPVMLKMYRKRQKQYEAMGYVIETVPKSGQIAESAKESVRGGE